MLISAIIPIGNVKRDFDNLLSIAKSVKGLNFELILVFDSQSSSELVAKLKRVISEIIENIVFNIRAIGTINIKTFNIFCNILCNTPFNWNETSNTLK